MRFSPEICKFGLFQLYCSRSNYTFAFRLEYTCIEPKNIFLISIKIQYNLIEMQLSIRIASIKIKSPEYYYTRLHQEAQQ